MQALMFYIFAALTLTGAAGVLLSGNIVRMAVQLLLALLGVSGVYILMAAEFLAAVQFVIYVGGTLVLIIFGVMLTARVSLHELNSTRIERFVAIFAGVMLCAALISAIYAGHFASPAPVIHPYPTQALGQHLLGDYMLPFELASLLLLAVMIGAAYLARRPAQTTSPMSSKTKAGL